MKHRSPGKIVIISSPSGGGKTSICRRLLSPSRKRLGWKFSISYTTRARRRGERDGREYCFVDKEKFTRLARAGFFAEHCLVHLYHYGTPRRPLEEVATSGGVLILDVDVQGAFKLKKAYPQAITIFVLPPSVAELRRRLKRRGTESQEQLAVRFRNSRREMKLYPRFDYVVINDDLKRAVRQVLSILDGHFCRSERLDPEQMARITG
ncbi:MAG TPA: guanylate kinase [Candidatus Deferrimicrobium sp.]|nr:guanylate kinase [Candidatus Deferrimicrobium sp.]